MSNLGSMAFGYGSAVFVLCVYRLRSFEGRKHHGNRSMTLDWKALDVVCFWCNASERPTESVYCHIYASKLPWSHGRVYLQVYAPFEHWYSPIPDVHLGFPLAETPFLKAP